MEFDFNDNRVVKQLETKKAEVVLSFDDGPSRYLSDILDILQEEKIPAHFFWQARLLHSKRPWKRVVEQGHQLGTHSLRHRNLTKLSFDEQYHDMLKSVQRIEQITKENVRWFRPPFGQYNDDTLNVCRQLKLVPVLWTVHSFDWEKQTSPEKICHYVVEKLHSGAIILLHERKVTVDALPKLIRQIKEQGYQFKTLS